MQVNERRKLRVSTVVNCWAVFRLPCSARLLVKKESPNGEFVLGHDACSREA
jgi:hypothetical protein